MADGLLTPKEAADWLSVSTETLRVLRIEHTREKGRAWYDVRDLQQFADSHGTEQPVRPRVGRVAITPEDREFILKRDGYECQVCHSKDGPFHIDHKTPVSRGGTNRRGNLWTLCEPCNLSKYDQTVEEFLARRGQHVN